MTHTESPSVKPVEVPTFIHVALPPSMADWTMWAGGEPPVDIERVAVDFVHYPAGSHLRDVVRFSKVWLVRQ